MQQQRLFWLALPKRSDGNRVVVLNLNAGITIVDVIRRLIADVRKQCLIH